MSELDTWKQLAEDASQGGLMLKVHEDDLTAAVKHLQNYIDTLKNLGHEVEYVAKVSGFGGFQIGVDLAKKFTDKGSGDESIKQRIKELAAEAEAIQDTIRKAAKAYAETDQAYADVLKAQ